MAGLRPPGLHGGQAVVVAGDGVVVLDALLGAALLVDLHQREGRGVVLHQTHLGGHGHHPGDWGERRRVRHFTTELNDTAFTQTERERETQ